MAPICLERWHLSPDCNQCKACRYLAQVGVFHRGAGPYPPLHPHCTCVLRRFVTDGVSEEAFLALVRQADSNGVWAARILARAERLLDRG